VIATAQVLTGLQINRWRGESTPLDNHVNVVLAILPAIYMRCAWMLVWSPSCTGHLRVSLDLINGCFSVWESRHGDIHANVDQQSSRHHHRH